jgi:hypothetical protein
LLRRLEDGSDLEEVVIVLTGGLPQDLRERRRARGCCFLWDRGMRSASAVHFFDIVVVLWKTEGVEDVVYETHGHAAAS